MAKVTKFNFPFSGVLGKYGNVDASRGRDPGISAGFVKQQGQTVYSAPVPHHTPVNPARQARAKIYCDCDCGWKNFPEMCKDRVVAWWGWVTGNSKWRLPSYQTYMQICLQEAPELPLFVKYCWIGTYRIFNSKDTNLLNQSVTLAGVPYRGGIGDDNEVWTKLPDGRLGVQIPRTVTAPGFIVIDVPVIPAHTSRYWDVYAYDRI